MKIQGIINLVAGTLVLTGLGRGGDGPKGVYSINGSPKNQFVRWIRQRLRSARHFSG